MESEEDEIITNLIPGPPTEYAKRDRYISKYKDYIQAEEKKGKCARRTFGVPKVTLRSPSQYLRKRSRKEYKTDVKYVHIHRPRHQQKLPSWVPVKAITRDKCGELPKDPVKLGRINFKKQNIIDVKKIQSHKFKEQYGNAHDLKLNPVNKNRKGYEKLPKITKQVKHEVKIKELKEEMSTNSKHSNVYFYIDKYKYHCISEEERKDLLNGMKQRWDIMMKQFQCLPFMIDTPPKVQRKTKLEYELKQLEKDIAIIERHPHICIYNGNKNE